MKKLQSMFRGYCFQQMKLGTCSAGKCKHCYVQIVHDKICGPRIASDIDKDFDPEKFRLALESYCCKQMKAFQCNNRDCTYCAVNEFINLLSSLERQAQ